MEDKLAVAKEIYYGIKEDSAKLKNMNDEELKSLQKIEGQLLLADQTFEELGVDKKLVQGLYKKMIDKPSHIQKICIPIIIQGKDAAFHSKSGTGKTIGFSVGILSKIVQGEGPQAIIVTPTRELNIQISREISTLASELGISVCCAVTEYREQQTNDEVVIGCPDKIRNLIKFNSVSTKNLKIVVLDEADHLIANQMFRLKTLRLLKILENCQKIFFSATYSPLSNEALDVISPNCVKLINENLKADNIKLYYMDLQKHKKIEILRKLFAVLQLSQVIVFVRTKRGVDFLCKDLADDSFTVSKIHGDVPKEERDLVLEEFKNAKTKILITTDVFSRGMDIPQVNLIINYDLPLPVQDRTNQTETYIHRIGRSGRFNRVGFVIDFVQTEVDLNAMLKIHSEINETSKCFDLDALLEVMTNE